MVHKFIRVGIGSFICLILVIAIESFTNISHASSSVFHPTPVQDQKWGRNSHVYLPQMTFPNVDQRKDFIQEISEYAVHASEKWGVPASAIIGMSVIESGYGTTRIAFYANNLFGIKVWGLKPANAWQLVGQPDEDFDRPVPVLHDYGNDRKIFNESVRRDNWYRKFDSYEHAVNYLAGTLLQNDRYRSSTSSFQQRIESGWSYRSAAKQFIYDIANAGYNHLGGAYYRGAVGSIMDQWDLYQYDEQQGVFRDIQHHWAKDEIERLYDLNIITGFNDRTFRPEDSISKEQFIKLLVEAMQYEHDDDIVSFSDVLTQRWSSPYMASAEKNGVIVSEEYGSEYTPDGSITREDMAIYTSRALELTPTNDDLFKDRYLINKHPELVSAAVLHGIIVGFTDQTFRPHDHLTRAQAVIVISRIMDYIE